MISLCIKSNNLKCLNFLNENLSNSNIKDIIFVIKYFSKYSNLIIHYFGNDIPYFYKELSNIISIYIKNFYESKIINSIIEKDYFYFSNYDLKIIKSYCTFSNKNLEIPFFRNSDNIKYLNSLLIDKQYLLNDSIHKYIFSNKSIYLDGFINFRLYDYKNTLNIIVDYIINQYIINKEYCEFIDLLEFYIKNEKSKCDLIHLIYINNESILLDKNLKIISIAKNNLDKFYLSDISFSSNDYTLNSLLTLLPKKIIIHLIDKEDDFIKTIKSIFINKFSICYNCNICNYYLENNSLIKNKEK